MDDAFGGLDDAVVEDRLPGLEPSGKYLLAVNKLKLFKARKAGLTLGIDYRVVESSHPAVVVGSARNTRLTGLDNPDKQSMQFGRIKQLLGGMFNQDPTSKQKWRALLDQLIAKPAAHAEFLVSAETGPIEKTQGGFSYMPIAFFPPPAGHSAMPAAQAKRFVQG